MDIEIASELPRRLADVIAAHVEERPHAIAVQDRQFTWTYAQLDVALQRLAKDLIALQIRPGDRIMLVSENSVAMAALLLAASSLDIWTIVINPRLSERELDQILAHSGARRMFFTTEVSKEAADHAARHGAEVRAVGPLGGIGVGRLNAEAVAEPVHDGGAEQVAVLIYTSGTTGTPKGVMLSHDNLLVSAAIGADLRSIAPSDKFYLVLPISHIVGISLLLMSLMKGATALLISRYEPGAMARALAEDGVTIVNGVPATYQRLLEYKTLNRIERLQKGALRLMSVAGAPLDVALKDRVEQEFGMPLYNGYGITECSPGISSVRPDAPVTDQSVGQLLPGLEGRLVGLDGRTVAEGEVGELHVRGRNVMLGYYRAPESTAQAIDRDGWFNTGDLAQISNGNLYIVGRTKEMIIRSGFNVYPAEIEAVIGGHPQVVQSAVVGRKVDSNEEVVAFVQLLEGSTVTADELARFINPLLTSYKRPSEIRIVPALPATSSGKILKHKLAESLRLEGEALVKA